MTGERIDFLRREQQLSVKLKALYASYGYNEFKLSSFEEYSLYAENQSFFGGKDVISFSLDGKLLALRPDVTLSIIKNGRFDGGAKLYYDEKVYRKAVGGGFSEVSQIGVETIGGIDVAAEAEVLILMLKTLAEVDKDYVLNVSHIGITTKVLESVGLKERDLDFARRCLETKNVHDLERFAAEKGVPPRKITLLKDLIALSAERQAARKALDQINREAEISEELAELDALFEFSQSERLRYDFSIGGDTDYYNGVVFKGYVKEVPRAVLSGGRYDKLLGKFGSKEHALGFALYLGELGSYIEDVPDSPDGVVIYHDRNALAAFRLAERLRAEGKNILFSRNVPSGFTGKVYQAEEADD